MVLAGCAEEDAPFYIGSPPPLSDAGQSPTSDAGQSSTSDAGQPWRGSGILPLGATEVADAISYEGDKILVANSTSNTVDVVSVSQGVLESFQLSSGPKSLSLSPEGDSVLASLSGSNSFVRISLPSGDQDTFAMPDPVEGVLAGPSGAMFVVQTAGDGYQRELVWLDAGGSALTSVVSSPLSNAPVFAIDVLNQDIFVTNQGISAATVVRIGYSSGPPTLVQEMSTNSLGSNGQDIAVSSEGHLAIAMGGGNGSGYTIFDVQASDLGVSRGEWDTGAYPRGVAFDSNADHFFATNGTYAQLFDVDTHVSLAETLILSGTTSCSYATVIALGITENDATGWIVMGCGFDQDLAYIRLFDI